MKTLLLLEKQVSETPLECLTRFRSAYPEYAQVPMTYAGRLDPMASGLLLVLAGDAVHDKEKYLGLQKAYEATILLGVATDTYDVLGKIQEPVIKNQANTPGTIENILKSFVTTFKQPYPPYSSKTIAGVQMHELARLGELNDQVLPSREVTVYDIRDIKQAAISRSEIAADIRNRILQVTGDFRQAEILAGWKSWAEADLDGSVGVVSFTIHVSGGTYIRGIADQVGHQLGTGAVLYQLKRTQIGDFTLENKDF